MRSPSEPRQSHWQRVRRFSLLLLGVWFVVTWASIWFARELARLTVFGWPVSFYMAAQGSILAYVAIVGVYAWWMDRLDARCHAEELADEKSRGIVGETADDARGEVAANVAANAADNAADNAGEAQAENKGGSSIENKAGATDGK